MTRTALTVVALTILLAVVGCSATVPGVPSADPAPVPTEGLGSDPVPWVGRVCTAVLSFTTPAIKAPDFSAIKTASAARQTLAAYFGAALAGAQEGEKLLSAVGPTPVQGGDAAVTAVREDMAVVVQLFSTARTTVTTPDPNSAAFIAALDQVQATLSSFKTPDPIGAFASIPRLQRAAQQAPSCQRLPPL